MREPEIRVRLITLLNEIMNPLEVKIHELWPLINGNHAICQKELQSMEQQKCEHLKERTLQMKAIMVAYHKNGVATARQMLLRMIDLKVASSVVFHGLTYVQPDSDVRNALKGATHLPINLDQEAERINEEIINYENRCRQLALWAHKSGDSDEHLDLLHRGLQEYWEKYF